MGKNLALPVLFTWLLWPMASADTVTLRNGAKVDGDIVVSNAEQVTLRDAKGNFRVFRRDEIAKEELNDRGKAKPAPKPPEAPSTSAPPKEQHADQAPVAPTITEVLASGSGKDADSARKDALRQAVSQVVGSLVVASDVVANDELIDSKILTYSDGYVEKWEPVGEPTAKDGMVRMKIRAWVRQGKLTKALTDNKVPVKDVDLRSMQGQSETLAQQARSAEEVVDALFEGFPAKLLVAEPLTPVRVSGDASSTVFEVPVRVKVDMAKWKAFVAEAKRVLDPIAEAKGSEAWNTKMAGWYPLAGASAPPASKRPASKPATRNQEPDEVTEVRSSYWLNRFVSAQGRAMGSICMGPNDLRASLPLPKVGAERKRVVAVLDSMGGKLQWWQLPTDAWTSLLSTDWSMHVHADVLNADGESIANAEIEWTEYEETTRPGERPKKVAGGPGSGLGGKRLSVNHGNSDFLTFRCVFQVESGGTLSRPDARADFLCLLLPAALGKSGYGHDVFLAPAATFPYRFRIPGEVANFADGSKVIAEFVDP